MNIVINNEKEIHDIATYLAQHSALGSVITLTGTLGVGKTSFARKFIQSSTPIDDVQSPTFPIVLSYPHTAFSCDIYHIDCYRLKSQDEFYQLGVDDAFGSHIFLIEWPEIISSLLPPERLDISIAYGSKEFERELLFKGSKYWMDLLTDYYNGA